FADSTNPDEVVQVREQGDVTGLVVTGRQYWVTLTAGLPPMLLSYTDSKNTSPFVVFTIAEKLSGFADIAFWIYALLIALGVLIQVFIWCGRFGLCFNWNLLDSDNRVPGLIGFPNFWNSS